MASLTIVPMEPEHLVRIDLRDFDAKGLRAWPAFASRYKLARFYQSGGPTWSGLDGDTVVACAGVWFERRELAHGWAVTSAHVAAHALSFHKAFRRHIEAVWNDFPQLRRLQTCVHADHTVSQAWLGRLGLEPEGRMRRFLNGDDYILYARVR
ncbi:MAG: hypothetical protein AB7E47_02400 [Desulfovibrionaceae bacterium]